MTMITYEDNNCLSCDGSIINAPFSVDFDSISRSVIRAFDPSSQALPDQIYFYDYFGGPDSIQYFKQRDLKKLNQKALNLNTKSADWYVGPLDSNSTVYGFNDDMTLLPQFDASGSGNFLVLPSILC